MAIGDKSVSSMKCILPIIILLGAGCSKDIKSKPETRKDAPSLPSASAIKIKELESRIETLNAKVKELEARNVQLAKEKDSISDANYFLSKNVKWLEEENKQQCERLADRDANTKTLLWLEKSQFDIYYAMTNELPSECAKTAIDGYYQYFKENPVPNGVNWVEDW